jgi:hypothetical protein
MSTCSLHTGAPNDVPAPRALHTLTALGSTAVLLGGSGPLGSLPLGLSLHLLESPPLRQGLAQQQRLCDALSEVSLLSGRVGELEAQLGLAHSQVEEGARKLQVSRTAGSGDAGGGRHNRALPQHMLCAPCCHSMLATVMVSHRPCMAAGSRSTSILSCSHTQPAGV